MKMRVSTVGQVAGFVAFVGLCIWAGARGTLPWHRAPVAPPQVHVPTVNELHRYAEAKQAENFSELQSQDPSRRLRAAQNLPSAVREVAGYRGNFHPETPPELVQALADEDPQVRKAANGAF